MKRFTRFIAVSLAMLIGVSFAMAQHGKLQTKAQYLGLKTGKVVHHQVVQDHDFLTGPRTMLLEEGFDVQDLFPPDGWSQIINNVDYTWMQSNPEAPAPDFSTIDPNSQFSALCPWVTADQDEWLITNEVNANGETPLKLTWYAGTSGGWLNNATLKCLISTDNGTTWTELWNALDEIDPAADWGWNKVEINLDAYAATPFKIAWQYVGNDGDLAGVDGVKIKSGYDYLFTDDFETFTPGQYVALNGDPDWWTTWQNNPGSGEDAKITSYRAASGSNSAWITGGTDLILKLGDKTSGKYQINFKYYIHSDSAGYFNIQRFEAPGVEWAYEVYFGKTGDGYMVLDGEQTAFFIYAHDKWLNIENIIDLTNDSAFMYIDGNLINAWVYSTGSDNGTVQLGGVDFYAGAPQGEEAYSRVSLDDVEYIVLDEGVQSPTIAVNPASFMVQVETGSTDTEVLTVSNEGQQTLSFDVTPIYDVGANYTPVHSQTGYTIPKTLNNQLSKVNIQASEPVTNNRDVILHYDGEPASAFGNQNNAIQWNIAAVFRADMIKDYVGMGLTSVDVFIGDGDVTTFKLKVWKMGSYNVPGPGDLIAEQDVTITPNTWNTIVLDNPIILNGQDLWVGYYIEAPAGNFVASTDDGTNYNPDGSWIAFGPGWQHLGDGNPDYNLNWNIRATLTGNAQIAWLSTNPTADSVEPGNSKDVDVIIDATNLTSGAYNGTLIVRSNDFANEWIEVPVQVAVFVGINENGEQGFVSMYPNPATSSVHLQANTVINKVVIYNAIGQAVYSSVVGGKVADIDLNTLNKGVYFVKTDSDLGTTTQKLIVK